jgi:glutamine cyclotransferase
MRAERLWILVIGLVVLAASTVIVFDRFRSAPKPAQRQRTAAAPDTVKSVYQYEVVREGPHDMQAFTQGLIFVDGFLYESTGGTGRSS